MYIENTMKIIHKLLKIGREESDEEKVRIFKGAAMGAKLPPHGGGVTGPLKDAPHVAQDDIAFVASTGLLSKWSDVEYIGPGARQAEERRRAKLRLEVVPPVEELEVGTAIVPEAREDPKPKARKKRKETIREKLHRLRAELRDGPK